MACAGGGWIRLWAFWLVLASVWCQKGLGPITRTVVLRSGRRPVKSSPLHIPKCMQIDISYSEPYQSRLLNLPWRRACRTTLSFSSRCQATQRAAAAIYRL